MHPIIEHLRKATHRAPLVSVSTVVLCSILAIKTNFLFLIPGVFVLAILCCIKAWRLVLLSLLLGVYSFGMCLHYQSKEKMLLARCLAGNGAIIESEGSVVKTYSKSAWMQFESPDVLMEVIFPKNTVITLGEKWRIRGLANPIGNNLSPGAFDRRSWLRNHHITCRLTPIDFQLAGEGNTWSRILAVSESWRNSISEILTKGSSMEDKRTQVMVSLLLGDKRHMDRDTLDSFRTGGCLHVFAVSGLHVGLAAGLIFLALSRFPFHPVMTKLLTLPPLAVYVFVTGMSASAMRAFVMICLLFLGTALRKRVNSLNILAFAAILFLFIDPYQLYDPGFLLSFLIFTVVVISGTWESNRPPWWSPDPLIPKHIYSRRERFCVWLEKNFRTSVIVSICCWLAAIPVTASCFGTFNLYAAILNVTIVPLIPPLMASCLLSVAFFWCHPILLLLNAISRYLASILLAVAGVFSAQPEALIPWSLPADPGQALAIPLFSGGCAIICGNPAVVINPGSTNDAEFTILPALRDQGFRVNAVLSTHSRKNKTQGADAIMKAFPHAINLGTPPQWRNSFVIQTPESGKFTVFRSPARLTTGIMDDQCPIILWEHNGRKFLYVATAPFNALERIIPKVGKIDILCTGFHAKDPCDLGNELVSTGAGHIIFTPHLNSPPLPKIPPPVKTWDIYATGTLLIDMGQEHPSVEAWKVNSENRTE